MRLEQLNQILKIKEHESFSKAANDIFISQPSLSISVNNLEEELHLKIFERSNTGVVPTEQGKEVLRLAKAVLDLSEKITGIMNGKIQNLQMGIPAAFANAIVPDLLRQFRELYPDVSLHILETPYYEILDLMDKGTCSIGVIGCVGVDHERDLHIHLQEKKLASEIVPQKASLKLFISCKNPLASRESISISEINNLRIISYKDNYEGVFRYLKLNKKNPIIVEDIELLSKLISEDFGCSINIDILAVNNLYIESGLIKVIPIKELSTEPSNIYILYSNHESLTSIEKELLSIVVELIRNKL
ncbi:LysR family transcriptional regulator [Desulfosporosinus shakirovi]|uniref:LysR family transcriptional regulator n=1 Tax=Desulfosporosinus shakirovi TaxID=2885154 RepID=UPI001E4E80F7|nr:LysR family transcriptional regulator [Desulfosporosinus sp. SRJS8]MCB8817840.1 LysR family transcriptional regulator [Desulfosporosinus sp. SRJS8]